MGVNRPEGQEESQIVGSEVPIQETDTDTLPVQDNVIAEIKGPDPEVWGTEEERAAQQPAPPEIAGASFEIDEIRNAGTDEEVKGPGPEWAWTKGEG